MAKRVLVVVLVVAILSFGAWFAPRNKALTHVPEGEALVIGSRTTAEAAALVYAPSLLNVPERVTERTRIIMVEASQLQQASAQGIATLRGYFNMGYPIAVFGDGMEAISLEGILGVYTKHHASLGSEARRLAYGFKRMSPDVYHSFDIVTGPAGDISFEQIALSTLLLSTSTLGQKASEPLSEWTLAGCHTTHYIAPGGVGSYATTASGFFLPQEHEADTSKDYWLLTLSHTSQAGTQQMASFNSMVAPTGGQSVVEYDGPQFYLNPERTIRGLNQSSPGENPVIRHQVNFTRGTKEAKGSYEWRQAVMTASPEGEAGVSHTISTTVIIGKSTHLTRWVFSYSK